MSDANDPMRWRELAREPIADYRVFSVERSRAASPVDGSEHTFYRIRSTSWTQVVPVTKDDHVVLVRQYRHGAEKVTLEIPGGLVDPGEDPKAAALRECFEETGYRARDARSLGSVSPNPALFSNRLYGYVADGVVLEGEIQNQGAEQTAVVLLPVREIAGKILSGEIDHALVVSTLWRFLYERERR